MLNKKEINDYFKLYGIYEVLDKYHEVDDLYIVLNIIIENKMFSQFDNVLSRFPKTNEYDEIKEDILNKYFKYINSYEIMDIIIKIDSGQLKENVFKKYIGIFNDEELYTMYLHIDDSKKEIFLEKYIKYYNSYVFCRICLKLFRSKNDNIKKVNIFLDKYIDLFNTVSLSQLITYCTKIRKDSIDILIQKLLNKTNNKETIKNL